MPNVNPRHQEALRLRRQGMSYSQIASALGYGAYPSAAQYAVRAALRAEGTTTISTDRQFGVEAEFFNITPERAVEALRAVGISVEYLGYTHNVTAEWKIVTDGSVSAVGTGRSSGLELVSPILKGQAGLDEMEKALNALHNAGAKVNTTCGLHVHVDTAGMNGMQRKNFFNLYVKNQSVMDKLVSKSRRNNRNYTCPFTPSQAEQYATHIERGESGYTRYWTVNVNSFPKYGTLEFRQHQGTLNGKKAVNWVKMLLAMATTAQATTTEITVEVSTVNELMTAINLESSVKSYFVAREASLNYRARVAA